MPRLNIVTYKVHDGKAEENKKLVEAVFAKLNANKPAGVKYASTIADDKLTFTHIAFFDGDTGALTELAEFKEFQKDLKSRCEIPPQVKTCDLVGNYDLF